MRIDEAVSKLIERLGFWIDKSGPTAVLREVGGGCHPATKSELALWDTLAAAREANPAEDEGRAITAVEVMLFGRACYLPADIAQEVEQACAAHAQQPAAVGEHDLSPAKPEPLTNADLNPGDIVRCYDKEWRVQGIDDNDPVAGLLLLDVAEPKDAPDFVDDAYPVTRGSSRRPEFGPIHRRRWCWGHAWDAELVSRGEPEARVGGQREALLANPHTGTPRDYRDVESDPAGVLIHKTGEPLRAAPHQPEPEARVGGEWELVYPDGTVAAREPTAIKALARLNGYKPTVEALLAYEQQGYRIRPATPPPSAVPEGLTARDRSVLRFALHRFMGEAYARHNEASQKTTAGLYASGAAERFYRDAKDAERLLSVFAAAPKPGEGE